MTWVTGPVKPRHGPRIRWQYLLGSPQPPCSRRARRREGWTWDGTRQGATAAAAAAAKAPKPQQPQQPQQPQLWAKAHEETSRGVGQPQQEAKASPAAAAAAAGARREQKAARVGTISQWVSTMYAASSQFSPYDHSARQLLGAPNVTPKHGSSTRAWSAVPRPGHSCEWVRVGWQACGVPGAQRRSHRGDEQPGQRRRDSGASHPMTGQCRALCAVYYVGRLARVAGRR